MIRPVVEISDGLRLDDVTAGRLVEQMLVALAIDHAAAERMLDALADRVHADTWAMSSVSSGSLPA